MAAPSLRERLFAKIDVRGPDDCWFWTASKNAAGYGMISVGGRARGAHRVTYEIEVGPVPKGHEIRHTCDQRACCNPRHLTTGTHHQNILDIRDRNRGSIQVLTEPDVLSCREEYYKNGVKQTTLAARYGVTLSAINGAVLGKTWSHLGRPPEDVIKAANRRCRAKRRGTDMSHAKLTREDVLAIRRRHAAESISQKALAAQYGVSQMVVSRLLAGKTYVDVR